MKIPPDAHPVEWMKSERWKVKPKRSQEPESRSQEDASPRLAVVVLVLVVVLDWLTLSRLAACIRQKASEMVVRDAVSHLESPLFTREVPPTLWSVTTRKSRTTTTIGARPPGSWILAPGSFFTLPAPVSGFEKQYRSLSFG